MTRRIIRVKLETLPEGNCEDSTIYTYYSGFIVDMLGCLAPS